MNQPALLKGSFGRGTAKKEQRFVWETARESNKARGLRNCCGWVMFQKVVPDGMMIIDGVCA